MTDIMMCYTRAYDKAAAETWGEFARLNLPSLNSEENFA